MTILIMTAVIVFSSLETSGAESGYYFVREPVGYMGDVHWMSWLRNTSLEDRGVLLESNTSQGSLQQLTICFQFSLAYGLPSCLFDVSGIQFFYSSPLEPRYGHIRFTTEEDRTLLFKQDMWFVGGTPVKVCLSVALESDLTSHVKLFWEGAKILDNKGSVKGPLKINDRPNYLGICKLSDISQLQPLETDGMDGWIQDFRLWPSALDEDTMADLTSCQKQPDEVDLSPSLSQSKITFKGGAAYNIPRRDFCVTADKSLRPLYLKSRKSYQSHKFKCDIFGGDLFLPEKQDDLGIFFQHINHTARDSNLVTGTDTCDKFWIPIKKRGEAGWIKDNTNVVTFLPFAPGEPNGGNYQQCIAARVKETASSTEESNSYQDGSNST